MDVPVLVLTKSTLYEKPSPISSLDLATDSNPFVGSHKVRYIKQQLHEHDCRVNYHGSHNCMSIYISIQECRHLEPFL